MPGMSYEATLERREQVVRLHRAGRVGWQIAFDLGLSERTVQRHLTGWRRGRAVGKPGPTKGCPGTPGSRHRHERIWARRERVAQLSAQGLSWLEIAALLKISLRAVRRDRTEYNRKMRNR